ncbi:mitochondrial fission factor-like isoform X2 [Lates calcarifer]|uniref:Mitochondrial fission factor n=1 Tax=Lates calcarifer TaxID=8187 RepID=A0AAJ8B168_LATCA|nr:mitochondrial fission factor-like isoform X2 [Lates calcarifer]
MAFTLYPKEMSQLPKYDPAFMEVINKNMHVPERLSIGPRQQWPSGEGEEAMRQPEETPPAYTMQVPDRLTFTEAPDMSPRPLFGPSRPITCSALGLEPCWESPSGEVFYREAPQSPIRRSYSDQSFGRTPPSTPTLLKQTLALPRHPSSSRGSGHPLRCTASLSAQTTNPQTHEESSLASSHSCLSPHFILQAARQLGLQASHLLLQIIHQKYRLSNQEKPPPVRVKPEVSASAHVENNKKSMPYSNQPHSRLDFIVSSIRETTCLHQRSPLHYFLQCSWDKKFFLVMNSGELEPRRGGRSCS